MKWIVTFEIPPMRALHHEEITADTQEQAIGQLKTSKQHPIRIIKALEKPERERFYGSGHPYN